MKQPIPKGFASAFTREANEATYYAQEWKDAFHSARSAGWPVGKSMDIADRAVPEHLPAQQRAAKKKSQQH